MELMGLLGVLDDVQRNACDIPLIRSYTPGPPEQAKVLNTWPFVEIVEATPARPYVCHLLKATYQSVYDPKTDRVSSGNYKIHQSEYP